MLRNGTDSTSLTVLASNYGQRKWVSESIARGFPKIPPFPCMTTHSAACQASPWDCARKIIYGRQGWGVQGATSLSRRRVRAPRNMTSSEVETCSSDIGQCTSQVGGLPANVGSFQQNDSSDRRFCILRYGAVY